jgi:hypothetical protein
MASSSLDWSSLITGGDNNNDPSVLYSDMVRTDASGNTYTLSCVIGANAADRISVCNADGSVFGSFAYTGNGVLAVKRNSSGVVQWYGTGLVSGNLAITPCDIDVDGNGNMYVCGFTYANTTFAGSNATTATVSRTGGSFSAFLARWNSSGVVQWALNPITPTASGNSLVTNLRCYNNEVYVVGGADPNLSYTIRNSDGTTFRTITTASDNGMFIKYNSSGTVTAAFKVLSGASRGLQIDLDPSGNVYVGGRLDTSLTSYTIRNYVSGTESSSSITLTTSTGNDAFLIKYNSTFTAQWVVSFIGTGNNDLLCGMVITSTRLLTSLNVSSTSLTIQRNTGSGLSTLATLTLASTSGSVLLAFDLNGGLSWNARTEPSGTGGVYIDSYTIDSAGLIYITGTNRATGVIYRSPANVTTTINRVGYLGDMYIICTTSAGEYVKHWYIKNANSWSPWFTQSFTSDIVSYGSKLIMHINDGYSMGNPSLKSLLNNTLVVAFKVTTNTSVSRIFDFCLGNTTNSYLFCTGNFGNNNFSINGRWRAAAETVLATGVATQVNTQYVMTMYIQGTSIVFFIYSWNGSVVSQVYTGTLTYSNGGGSTAPLNQLRTLWFGRSSYVGDPFFSGSFQKILMFSGQITTPTTTLPLIFTSASANSASGTKYTFGAAAGYTAMSVFMYNTPTNTTSEVTLASASRQYLALTDLTILEEDATRMYDSSNNLLGTISTPTNKSLMAGYQTATVVLDTGVNAGTISGTTPIGFNTTTTLTVSNSNGNLQWQSSPNNSTWSDIADATSTTYTTPTQTNGTYYYRVVVTLNGVTANSASFTLVVDPQAIAGSISGSLGPLAYYGSTALSLSGNTGATLQWQISFDNSIWSDIAGATTASHATQLLTVNTYYRVRVNNGTSRVFTDPVTVQVNAPTPATSEVAPLEYSLTLSSGLDTQTTINTDVKLDSFGNYYYIGHTVSSGFSISGSQGNFTVSGTVYRSYVAKYNSSGIPLWGRLIGPGSAGNTYGYSIDEDSSLNVYAMGYNTNGSGFTLSGTNGNFTSSGTGTNMYIVKYSTSGTPEWAKLINDVSTDNGGQSAASAVGFGLAATPSGQVYIVGSTATSGFTLSGVNGGFTQAVTHTDAFIAMYNNDASGTLMWARRIVSASGSELAYKVAADAVGNAYIVGNTNTSGVTISGVSGGFTKTNSTISPFFAKYDTTGTLLWAQQFGNPSGTIRAFNTNVDICGNMYVVGYSQVSGFTISGVSGGFVTNSTNMSGDAFLAKYDTNGVLQWANNIGSSISGTDYNFGVTTDVCGTVYITGSTNGDSVSFSGVSGFSRKTVNASYARDGYIASFNGNGTLLWGKFVMGMGNATVNAVAVNVAANRIIVAGSTNSKTTAINKGYVNQQAMLAKTDALGNVQWTAVDDSINYDTNLLAIDGSGNSYVSARQSTSGLTISGTNGGFTKGNSATSQFTGKYNASGVLEWVAQTLGLSGTINMTRMAYNTFTDELIMLGRTANTSVSLIGVSGNATYSGTGSTPILQSISPSGTVYWNQIIGQATGANQFTITNLTTDSSGFIYTTGSISTSGVIITGVSGFSTGSINISGAVSASVGYLTKHNAQGQVLWARITGSGFSSSSIDAVAVDANGSVIIGGRNNQSGFTLSGLSGGITIGTSGSSIGYIAEYNVSGDLLWAKQVGYGFGTSGYTLTSQSIKTDASNNIYVNATVTGASGLTISGALNSVSIGNNIYGYAILVKYDANGNPQWAQNVNPSTTPYMDTDTSGNIVVQYPTSLASFTTVSGYTVSGFTKSDTATETIIAKYSATQGDIVYWRRVYGTGARGMRVDNNWNMYMMLTPTGQYFSLDNNNTASGTNNLSGFSASVMNTATQTYGFFTAYNLTNAGPTSFSGAVVGGPITVGYNQARPLTVSGVRGAVQWQSSTDNLSWSDIVGGTGQTYLTGGLTATTFYRARSTYGSAPSALTASVQLTVNGQSIPGTISGQLPNAGFNTTKALVLTGSSGSIQWQSSTDGLNFTNIPTATATTYTTPSLTASTFYRALVRNGASDPAYATAVQVVVDAATVAGSITGTNRITTGSTTNLTLSGFTANWFQWQSSPNGSTWTDITGASGTTYTTPTLTANTVMNSTASTPYYYRVNARNGNSASGVTSSYTVTVDAISVAGVIGVSNPTQNAGYNTTKILTLSGYTGSIQWQTMSGADYASIAGATSASYTTPALTLSSYSYRAVVTNGVSPAVTATPVIINVDAQSVAGTITGGNSTVQAGETYTLSLAGNAGTIQWQTSSNNSTWSNISGATSSSYTTPQLYNPLTYYRAVVTNGNSAAANSTSVLFTINALFQTGSAYAGGIGVSGIPWFNYRMCKMDPSGNMYFAGNMFNPYTLSGQFNNYVQSVSGQQVLITKLDPSGNVLFATQVGTGVSGNVDLYGMTYDSQGNMYVAGQTYLSGYTISGPNGGFVKSTNNNWDGYFAKYNASGLPVWGQLISGSGVTTESCNDMFVDSADNLYMSLVISTSGYTLSGTIRSFTTDRTGATTVISRVDTTSGGLIWNQGFNGSSSNKGNCIMKNYNNMLFAKLGISTSGLTVSGLSGSFTTISGGANAFMTFDTSNGQINLASATNIPFTVNGCDIDFSGNIICAGHTSTSGLTISGLSGNITKSTNAIQDSLLVKFNNVGLPIWARLTGASLTPTSWDDVVVDGNGNIITKTAGASLTFSGTFGSTTGGIRTNMYDADGISLLWSQNTSGIMSMDKIDINKVSSRNEIFVNGFRYRLRPIVATTICGHTPNVGTSLSRRLYSYGNVGGIQWQQSADGSTSWSDIVGATQDAYVVQNASASTFYRVTVTGQVSGSLFTSSGQRLVVDPPSVAGSISGASLIQKGTSTTLTTAGNTGTLQWQSSADGVSWANIASATSASYTTSRLFTTTHYRVAVTNLQSPTVFTSGLMIATSDLSNPGAITGGNVDVLYGVTGPTLTVVGNTGTIQWQSSADNATWTNISGATAATYATGTMTANTYYRVVVTNGGSPAANSVSVGVFVDNNKKSIAEVLTATNLDIFGSSVQFNDVSMDAAGNMFVVGNTTLSGFTLSGANGGFTIVNPSGYGFVAKYNASGVVDWASLIGAGTYIVPTSVFNDANGLTHIVGCVSGAAGSISGLSGNVNYNSGNTFYAQVNASGRLAWNSLICSSPGAFANKVFVNASNLICVVNQSGAGNTHLLTMNMCGLSRRVAGALFWSGGSLGTDIPYAGVMDSSGSMWITGAFNSQATVSGVSGTFAVASVGRGGMFISHINSSGINQWNKLMGNTYNAGAGTGVAIDQSGNSYVTGFVNTAITISGLSGNFVKTTSGNNDIVLVKYNRAGTCLWANYVGTAAGDNETVNNLAADAAGNVWLAGFTHSSGFTMSGLSGGFVKVNTAQEAFVANYNANGTLQWAQLIRGYGKTLATGVALNISAGKFAIVGNTNKFGAGNLDFTISGRSAQTEMILYNYDGFGNFTSNAIITVSGARAHAMNQSGNFAVISNMSGRDIGIFNNAGAVLNRFTTNSAITPVGGIGYANDFIYFTGSLNSFGLTVSGLSGGFTKGANNNTEFCLSCYDTTGNLMWAKLTGIFTTMYESKFDYSGNSYVFGQVSGSNHMRIEKWLPNGTLGWGTNIGYATMTPVTNPSMYVNTSGFIGLTYTTNASGLTLSGTYGGVTPIGTLFNVYVGQMNNSGVLMYGRRIVTSGGQSPQIYNVGYNTGTNKLIGDSSGNLYVTATSSTSGLTLSGGTLGNFSITDGSQSTGFIQKFDSSGSLVWGRIIGYGGGIGVAANVLGSAIDPSGNVTFMMNGLGNTYTISGANKTISGNATYSVTFNMSGNTMNAYGFGGDVLNNIVDNNNLFVNLSGTFTGLNYLSVNNLTVPIARTTVSGIFNGFLNSYNLRALGGVIGGNDVNLAYNASRTLTVVGSYGTLQWQSSADGVTYSDIPTATSTSYTTLNLTASTFYRVQVTDAVNGFNATSAVAQVVVDPESVAGTITGAETSAGYNTGKTLTLSGNVGTVQWQSSVDNATFSNIPNATSTTYTTPNLVSSLYFRAVVTSGVNPSVTSTAVQVVVDAPTNPGIITISSVAAGAAVPAPINTNRILVLRGYVATSIQWQQSADGATYSDIGGATADTYATANVTARIHYRARLQNGNSAAAFTQPLMVVAQVLSAYSSLVLGGSIQNTQVTNLRSTALDNTGNLFVIGDTNASGFTLSGAQGGFTVSGANGYDAFIAMYNSSGAVQWARLIASAQTDTGYGVTTDTSGNVYAVASVGNVGTISGISGGFTKTTTDIDAALIKYSASGTIIMARLIGAAQFTDTPAGLTVDTCGNVFIAGTTNSSGYTLSGAQGGFTTSGSDSNAFVVEYDINGTVQWARLVGALGANDFGYGVSLDSTDGSVYMTGVVATSGYTLSGVSGGFTKITTDNDAFFAKYSASGVLQYGRVIAGLGADFGYGISNDASGNAFVVGYTASSGITLSGPMGGFTKTNNRQTAFLAKYSGAGAIQWARQIGVSGVQSAFGVSCDPTGYVWVTGITTESGLTISGVSGGMYKTNDALDSFVASYDSVSGILNRAQLVAGAGASGLAVAAIAQNTTVNRLAIVGGTATTNTDINYAVTLKTTASPQSMIGRVNASGVPLWNAFTGAANPFGMATDSLGNSFVVDSSGILTKYDIVGNVAWSYTFSGAGTTNMNVATDNLNNVWVAGFSNTNGFTLSGAGISGFIKNNANNDSFIAKISNNSGVLQWAQLIPNTNQNQHVAVDASGNAIVGVNTSVIGFTMSGISGSYTKAHSSMEYVVLKYTTSGILQWVKQMSPSGFFANGNQITTDINNQIVIAGYAANASGLTISGSNGRFTTSGTGQMLYGVTLTPAGDIKWAQLINGALGGVAYATNATDASGFVYTLCPTYAAVTISGISGGFTKTTATQDLFVTKHESVSGVLHWARLIPFGAQANGIQVDTSGFVYVMGQTNLSGFNGSGVFATKSTTTTDTFVMKYDPVGALQNYGYYYYNTMANNLQFRRALAADAAGSITFATSVSGPFNMYNWPNSTYGFAKQYLINPQPVAGTISGPATTVGYNKTTTLTLTGNAGTIQWQSSTNGTTYSDIASATNATYTTPTLTASTYYRVAVTNGPASPAISDAVQVVVDVESVAGTISGNTPNAGYNKTKTLTLAGNTGTIQWQSSTDNVTFSNIDLATSSTYTTPALTATLFYRAVVTSGNSDPVTATSVQVQVDAQSVAGTLAGPASNVGYNKTAALTVTGSTGTIAWYMSTDNSNFSVVAGQTSASYSPTLTATTYFYITATNGNSDPVTSSTVTVTVDGPSVAGTITGNRTVVLGTNYTTLTLSGNTGTIQWQSSTDNATFTNINGATASTYNAVNLTVTTYYRVVVTNGASDADTSAAVTMTVISFVKPDPPTVVSVVGRNAAVQVSWDKPAFDGNRTITGYVIKAYLDSDNSLVSTTPFDSSILTRTVTSLTNGTAYKFTVSAVNSIGTSDESTMSSAVTPSTTAPPPTNVALAIDDSTGVATVTWTTNTSNNGGSAITGYRVAITPGNFVDTLNGNTTSTTTFNLTFFGALYSATVTSINGNGPGTPSSAATDTYDNPVIIQAVQDSQTSSNAIAIYSQNVNKTPTELFLELKTTARNQVNASGAPLTQDQGTRTQIANAVADKAAVDITTAPLILSLTASQASVLLSASVQSIPLEEVRSTVSVIPPLNEALKTATVDLTAMQSTLLANGIDLESGVSSSDLHIDIPPQYEMTLTFKGASRTLVYDGTTLRDKSTNELITLGSIVAVGTGVFRVTSIGSVSFQTLPPYVLDIVGNTTAPTHILAQQGMNIRINNAFGPQ